MNLLNPMAAFGALDKRLKSIEELIRTGVETHVEDRVGARHFNEATFTSCGSATTNKILLTVTPPQGFAWRLRYLHLGSSLFHDELNLIDGVTFQLVRGKQPMIGWDKIRWPFGTVTQPREVYLVGNANESLVVRSTNLNASLEAELCVVVGGVFYSVEGGGA